MKRWWLLFGWLLGTPLSCGDHEPNLPRPAIASRCSDASVSSDTGVPQEQDATVKPFDAATGTDGEVGDAGIADAGIADAGIADAGIADAGIADAGIADAGPQLPDAADSGGWSDAATPLDAGAMDASVDDAAVAPPEFVGIDTLASRVVRAGDVIAVTCLLLNQAQAGVVAATNLGVELRWFPQDAAAVDESGLLYAKRAGELGVACSYPALGFEDTTPATVKVLTGVATRTVAHLDRVSITAGDMVEVSCELFDAWDNPIANLRPRLVSTPTNEKNRFTGATGTFEAAGSFGISCDLAGTDAASAPLQVLPGRPAALQIARMPDQVTYDVGQLIELRSVVTDRYGNLIPNAAVQVTSSPAGIQVSEAGFGYSKAGTYLLTAKVTTPTEGDVVLSKSVEVVVDSSGPSIRCDSPEHGEILRQAPGASLVFRGIVSDPSGVKELRVNGQPTAIDTAGHFSLPLTAEAGMNFVDLVAIDNRERKSTRGCAFLLSDRWVADATLLDDSLSLRLGQHAVDDFSRGDLDSIGDMLEVALNSEGLRDSIDGAMRANEVLKSGCDQVLLGRCVLSSSATYLDTRVDGPNSTKLLLAQDGLFSTTRVEGLGVQLELDGQVAGLSYRKQGWIEFESIEVDTTFELGVSGGRPRARVRPGSTSTKVGSITANFPGVDGALLQVAVDLANAPLRDYVALRLQAYVTDRLNAVLDGVISGLGVSNLRRDFAVAPLGAGTPISLQFGAEFSSVDTDPTRLLFGMGTRFSGPAAHAKPTLGAAMRAGPCLLDVVGAQPVGVAIHEGVFTQGLHALWRGGYFDATVDSSSENLALAAGTRVTFETALPPVAAVSGNRVTMSLGAVAAQLWLPALPGASVPMTMGARASMATRLVSGTMVFDDFKLDELHLSIDTPDLDPFVRSALESTVPAMLAYVVESALRDSLPALPVPSFALPSTLSSFGLPANANLGMTQPALFMESPHFVLRGNAGVW